MAVYIDGFVIPIPKRKLAAYQKVAAKAGKVWMECGALSYVEAVGEDMKQPFGLPFPKLAKIKPGETVLFSFITYKSRKHRDQVNKKVHAHPAMVKMSEEMQKNMPFDMNRMTFGGFKSIVEL